MCLANSQLSNFLERTGSKLVGYLKQKWASHDPMISILFVLNNFMKKSKTKSNGLMSDFFRRQAWHIHAFEISWKITSSEATRRLTKKIRCAIKPAFSRIKRILVYFRPHHCEQKRKIAHLMWFARWRWVLCLFVFLALSSFSICPLHQTVQNDCRICELIITFNSKMVGSQRPKFSFFVTRMMTRDLFAVANVLV